MSTGSSEHPSRFVSFEDFFDWHLKFNLCPSLLSRRPWLPLPCRSRDFASPQPRDGSKTNQRVDLSTFGQTHAHEMNDGSDDERSGPGGERVQCQNM